MPADVADVTATIKERGERYGNFGKESEISMALKHVMRYGVEDTPSNVAIFRAGWKNLSPAMQSALDLIALKVARILNGDPTYIDNWHDIQGYALLIENQLKAEQNGSLEVPQNGSD